MASRAGMASLQTNFLRTNFNSVDKQCYMFTSAFDNGNPRYGQRLHSSLLNAVTGEVITTALFVLGKIEVKS